MHLRGASSLSLLLQLQLAPLLMLAPLLPCVATSDGACARQCATSASSHFFWLMFRYKGTSITRKASLLYLLPLCGSQRALDSL